MPSEQPVQGLRVGIPLRPTIEKTAAQAWLVVTAVEDVAGRATVQCSPQGHIRAGSTANGLFHTEGFNAAGQWLVALRSPLLNHLRHGALHPTIVARHLFPQGPARRSTIHPHPAVRPADRHADHLLARRCTTDSIDRSKELWVRLAVQSLRQSSDPG
eukprot:CAMPEP_0204334106 /NCGR_PEP_ID=MMETSP0469-20131031/17766_1 /ASSEMBLY_ACC=CAM_ASM_000384 /TAXON_ID=2969 /ORGANISM="Oxyrrhis marina" /LENGTH=157 /DNA_ID=CAMNT_0051317573 /DNA_START=841 /DNA_END=1314 /DNA_ORIENTATION=-